MRSKTVPWGPRALSLLVVAAAVAAAGLPRARAEAPPADLAPVVMDEQVVRLPRAEAAGDPLAAATVVEAARFEGEAKGVAELVATAPGVAVSDYGGLGQLATVSIRGSTDNGVLVLLDGLPLNTAFGGAVDLSTIPAGWIDRVEVVRGAEGALYGPGALGGVVNVLTPSGRAGRWTAEAAGGAFGTWQAGADGAMALGGGRTLLLAATASGTGGDYRYLYDATPILAGDPLVPRSRLNNAARRGGLLARLGAPVGAGGAARLDGLFQLSAGRRGLGGFGQALTLDDWQEDGRLLASVRLAAPGPAAGLSLSGRLTTRFDWLDARVGNPGPDPWRQRGLAAGLAGEARWSRGGAILVATAEGGAETVRARGLEATTRGRGSLALSADSLHADGRLRVAPALRLDVEGPFTGWSGRLGGAVRLGGPWSIRGGAGRTFRAPSLAELSLQQGSVLPNPDLRPEEGYAGDAALVGDGPLGLASLGVHATRYRDLVLYEVSSLGRLKPFNSGEALVTGLEAELASARILGPLGATLSAAWTWQRPRLVSDRPDEDGKDVPYRARTRLFARVGVAPGPVAAHLELHQVGRRFTDRRNLDPLAATVVWNAGAALRLRSDPLLRLHLEVKNLADDQTLGERYGSPLPGRMVMVTLRAGSATEGPTE